MLPSIQKTMGVLIWVAELQLFKDEKNEILIYVIKWIKLEDMLSENSETIHHVSCSLLYKIFIISGVGK